MWPSGSAKMRSPATFRASQSASDAPSAWVAPTRTSRPRPIDPATRSPAVTRARATRCTSALMRARAPRSPPGTDPGWTTSGPAARLARRRGCSEKPLAPLDAGDPLDLPDRPHQLLKLREVRHLDHEDASRRLVLARDPGGSDVHLAGGDGLGDVRQERGPVLPVHDQAHGEGLAPPGVPLDGDLALARHPIVEGVGTVLPVHRDAPSLGDDPDHAVSRHRLAAAREMEHDVVDALDADAPGRLAADPQRFERPLRQPLGERLLFRLELVEDGVRGQRSLREPRVHLLQVGAPQAQRDLLQLRIARLETLAAEL